MEQFVSFTVAEKTLSGVVHIPDSGAVGAPGIVLCHGFCGNKIGLHRLFVKAARAFAQAGYAVLRFDFSGCGDSEGSYEQITIDGQVTEARAALDLLRTLIGEGSQLYLVGLSMGGAVASLTSWYRDDLAGLVLWAPVANLYQDIRGIVGQELFGQVMAEGLADFEGFGLGRGFVESLQYNHPLVAAGSYRGPLLVIHGTGDQDLPWTNAHEYREARRFSPYSTQLHIIPDADHTFSGLKWEAELFQETLRWLRDRVNRSRGWSLAEDQERLTG